MEEALGLQVPLLTPALQVADEALQGALKRFLNFTCDSTSSDSPAGVPQVGFNAL